MLNMLDMKYKHPPPKQWVVRENGQSRPNPTLAVLAVPYATMTFD